MNLRINRDKNKKRARTILPGQKNLVAIFVAACIVVVGLASALVAHAVVQNHGNKAGNSQPANSDVSHKTKDIEGGKTMQAQSNTSATNNRSDLQSSAGESQGLHVSVNGQTIPVPKNSTVDKTIHDSSGNGDVHVSIQSTSGTSSDNNNESGSSASISINSSSTSTTTRGEEH